MQRYIAVVVCLVGCVKSDSLECAEDLTCPLDQRCDLEHHACVDPDQLAACEGQPDRTLCSAAAAPDGTCDKGVCLAAKCGDDVVQGLEECDGTAIPMTCTQLGYYDEAGTPACTDTCIFERVESRSGCTGYCGDGEVRIGIETCDGNDPPFACVDLGYLAGYLACNERTCNPRVDDCKPLGWTSTQMTARIKDVHGTADDNIFAVGSQISRAEYFNGLAWSPIPLDGCAVTPTTYFNSVVAVGPGEAFAVASNVPELLRLTPTGCTRLPATPSVPTDVWASSATNVYATTSAGIYRYDGTSWTLVSNVARDVIWGSGPNDIWAGGPTGNTLSHYDGQSWSTTAATLPGATDVNAIWGTSTEVYAAGPSGAISSMFRSNGSATWTAIPTGKASAPFSGTVADARAFVGFADGTVQEYDGTTWTVVQEAGIYSNVFTLWTAPTSGNVLAGVNAAPVLLTYAGTNRIDMPSNGDGDWMAIKSPSEIYVIDQGDPYSSQLWRWTGTNWATEANVGENPTDIWVDSVGTVRAITAPGQTTAGGMRVRTGNNTWANMANSVPGVEMWGYSANDFWVMQGDTLGGPLNLRHFVNGAQQACASCAQVTSVFDIHGTSESNVFFVGNYAGNGKIFRWNGSSIVDTTPATPIGIVTVVRASPDGQHVWAGGTDGTLLHWNGTSWETVTPPNTASPIVGVFGTSPSDLFVGQIGFMYHFDGTRWSPVASRASGQIRDIQGFGDSVFYVDGSGNPSPLHSIVRTRPW